MTLPDRPGTPGPDLLGPPEAAPRAAGGRAGNLLVGLVGAAAVTIAGTGVAFAAYLGGGGAQPEQVLPASAFAMVKVDLDPAAGQKVAVHRLAGRFPTLAERVSDADSLKDDLLSALLEQDEDIDYERDIQPWIGDRVAIAALPGDREPEPLAAVAYRDRDTADTALRELSQEADGVFYAFSAHADYVLLGTSQDSVDAAADTSDVLADNESWQEGMDALDGDQILTAWADLGALWRGLPQEARDEAGAAYGLDDPEISGTVVVGAHVGDDHVEVVGHTIEITAPPQLVSPIGGRPGTGLVERLPADTVAAVSLTDLGDGLADSLETAFGEDDPLGVVGMGQELGLDLPDDLRALLGEETVAAVFSEQEGGLRTRTDDVDAAMRTAEALLELAGGGDGAVLRRLEDGIAMATSAQSLAALTDDDGGLGDTDAFRAAVPDADGAGTLIYLDIAQAVELFAPDLGDAEADVAQLRSLGFSSSGDDRNSTFRLRLTLRD